jgi:hypothetical protein
MNEPPGEIVEATRKPDIKIANAKVVLQRDYFVRQVSR